MEDAPQSNGIDPNLLLGLLANMNKGGGSPPQDNAANGGVADDLLMKFLLNGGLQRILTPKPPEPTRTINLDDYTRVD
jgi:hypothetical protein